MNNRKYHQQRVLDLLLSYHYCISEKKNGPNIEPSGTPSSILVHEEYFPFRIFFKEYFKEYFTRMFSIYFKD